MSCNIRVRSLDPWGNSGGAKEGSTNASTWQTTDQLHANATNDVILISKKKKIDNFNTGQVQDEDQLSVSLASAGRFIQRGLKTKGSRIQKVHV